MAISVLELGDSRQMYGDVLIAVSGNIRIASQGLVLVSTRANGEEETVAIQPTDSAKKVDVNDFVGKPVNVVGRFVPTKENRGTNTTGYIAFDSIKISPRSVSMVELLVRPEKYDQALVTVAGYYICGHRGPKLFVGKEDAEHRLFENMIPLEPSLAMQEVDDAAFDKKYVRITGKFVAYHPASIVVSKGYLIFEHVSLTTQQN